MMFSFNFFFGFTCLVAVYSFNANLSPKFLSRRAHFTKLCMSIDKPEEKIVTVLVPLGENYKPVECKFRPIFEDSTFFVTSYEVPFGLNVEKAPKGCPSPIVTKDGKGGEKAGDLLRATTCWSQGFVAAGATSDIAQFAGNVKWRKSIFDTAGAPWDQVVEALVSNTSERSTTVTLVFEREVASE